jgi:hypothetical protein
MNKVDNIISLGYNCYIKKFLDTEKLCTTTNFFDYIGSSFWSINELFYNKFEGLYDRNNYIYIQVVTNKDKIVVHKNYYLRFLHDFTGGDIVDNAFDIFTSKYKRRIERLYNILNTSKTIIFIRNEELFDNKINMENYSEKFKKNEIEYAIDFCNYVKSNFCDLNFFLIFISYKMDTFFDNINNILILHIDKEQTWQNCNIVLSDLFKENSAVINNIIETVLLNK